MGEEEGDFVKANLKALNDRSDCKTALWLPSRNEFRAVRRSDGVQKHIRVIGLNSARKQWEGRGADGLKTLYDQAGASAIEFLFGQPVPLAGEEPQGGGEADPLDGEDHDQADASAIELLVGQTAPLADEQPHGGGEATPSGSGRTVRQR